MRERMGTALTDEVAGGWMAGAEGNCMPVRNRHQRPSTGIRGETADVVKRMNWKTNTHENK